MIDASNGRVCLAANCRRLCNGTTCWLHTIVRMRTEADPYAEISDDVRSWWVSVQPRMVKLERLAADDALSPIVKQRAIVEASTVRFRLARMLLDSSVQAWHAETGLPSWQLPPAGWIFDHVNREVPDLTLGSKEPIYIEDEINQRDFMLPEVLDRLARKARERNHPSSPPFRPITDPRRAESAWIESLEEQESRNAEALAPLRKALWDYKHDNCHEGLIALFTEPGVDVSVPNNIVTVHQIAVPETTETSREHLTNKTFQDHLTLEVGQVLRYDHIRATTLKDDWIMNLGLTFALPEGLDTEGDEAALVLEMVPKTGLYIGKSLSRMIKSHLDTELELVLPPGTWWEIKDIADVEHQAGFKTGGGGTPDYRRLRTIRMVEIDRAEVGRRSIKSMTIPQVKVQNVSVASNAG